jgi:hypothetical protein
MRLLCSIIAIPACDVNGPAHDEDLVDMEPVNETMVFSFQPGLLGYYSLQFNSDRTARSPFCDWKLEFHRPA